MADNKVSVEISLEEKAALKALTQLTREINKTESSFKSMGDEGDASLGIVSEATKGLSDGFGALVKGVTVANLASEAIIGTANAIKNFAIESVNAALEAEASNQRLAQSLKATNSFTQEGYEDLKAYAGALAETTAFGDDEIASQLALAKSFGATNQQAKQLVQAATELSATFGGSLDQRVEQLGKTLTGTGGKLDTLIPGFKALTEEQLKSGDAFEFINSKFGGAASAQLETYGGKLIQLKKSFSELQEAIGLLVVESGVDSVFSGVAAAINDMTQAISDSQVESKRAAGNFVETSASLEQLKRKQDELTLSLLETEETIRRGASFPDSSAMILARSELSKLNAEIKVTAELIKKAQPGVEQSVATANAAPSQGAITPTDQKTIDSRLAANAALQQAYVDMAAWEAEQELLKREITSANYQAEYEQLVGIEQAKIDAKFAAEEQKARAIEDAQTRQLTIAKLVADKELAIDKAKVDAKKKLDQSQIQLEAQKQAAILGIMGSTFALATTLTKDGTKEQFLLQKAAAAAQVVVATAQAMALAAAIPPGLPVTAPLVAYAKANGAIQLATIAASAIKGYESGGIIPGNSMTGDMVPARLNSGEMVLNRQQQTNLFNLANGQGGGSSAELMEMMKEVVRAIEGLNFVVDGRAIATVIRKEVQGGFRIS